MPVVCFSIPEPGTAAALKGYAELLVAFSQIRKFSRGFIFAKVKSSQNGTITLSITDIGKSCPSHEFKTSLI